MSGAIAKIDKGRKKIHIVIEKKDNDETESTENENKILEENEE